MKRLVLLIALVVNEVCWFKHNTSPSLSQHGKKVGFVSDFRNVIELFGGVAGLGEIEGQGA